MSRSNKTDNDLLAGLLRKAITKRLSGIGISQIDLKFGRNYDGA